MIELSLVQGPHCAGCTNQRFGVRRIEPDGTGRNGVALLGDSPWLYEMAAGIPFAGPAGDWLNGILQKRHLQRSDFTVFNAGQQCKPPHLGWTDHPERFPEAEAASQQCRPYLDAMLAARKPRAIVAMGGLALKRLTGFEGIEENHGYTIPGPNGIPVVPTFHPSHIIQGAHKLTISFVLALTRALEISGGSYIPTCYTLFEDPCLEELDAYLRKAYYAQLTRTRLPWKPPPTIEQIAAPNPDAFLMCDIETPESGKLDEEKAEDDASYNIVRMGFSNSNATGCSFPFEGGYIRKAKEAVRSARVLLFWNKNYDLPRLRAAGFELHPDVIVIDAMWAWHFLQSDLPKSLAFAAPFFYAGPPWKHLASQRPAYYNAMDNAVQTTCWLGIKAALQAEGRLDRFMRQVRCEPILVRMGEAGVRVDLVERNKFMDELKVDAATEYATVQRLTPPEVVKIKKWKRQPKDMTGVIETVDHNPIDLLLPDKKVWFKPLPFNPNSWQQLISLIKHYGLKVPRKRGEDRDTTESKYLLRFAKKHPIFGHVVEYKRREKLRSTYQWPLNAAMRATTVYGYHPSTWRLSSRKVNLQNIPKRSKLAERFRTMLVAAPGHVLIEADWEGIEAVLYGYLAGSESYIRLAKAGVHDWLASHVMKQPIDWQLPWSELRRRCLEIKRTKKLLHDACKHIVHGSNFLYTPYGINDDYGEYFPGGQREITELQRLYFSLPPGQDIRACHNRLLALAHKEKRLRNHFDGVHYFYEVFSYNRRSKRDELGDDAKRAAAYIVQSDAAFMQREVMLLIDESPEDRWLTRYTVNPIQPGLRLPTHDSLVAEIPDSSGMIESTAATMRRYMTRKWPELGGLDIGVEIKVGHNLEEQEVIDVSEPTAA